MKSITTLAVAIAMLQLLTGCEKARLDQQVKELCAKDGGIKVYETVKLPPVKYDEYARNNWIFPNKAQAKLTDDFFTETDRYYYKKGNPEMSRRQYRIIRHSDGKVLGESISYGRGGGDMPGPWHDSSYQCPPISKDYPGIEALIFQKGLPNEQRY